MVRASHSRNWGRKNIPGKTKSLGSGGQAESKIDIFKDQSRKQFKDTVSEVSRDWVKDHFLG